jgi:hypothetical protein
MESTNPSSELQQLNETMQAACRALHKNRKALIAIASALNYIRSQYSDKEEMTKSDRIIANICEPLDEIFLESTLLVAHTFHEHEIARDALGNYHRSALNITATQTEST